jgi:hypothetical protein
MSRGSWYDSISCTMGSITYVGEEEEEEEEEEEDGVGGGGG